MDHFKSPRPRTPSGLVDRPRLVDRLNKAPEAKAILITAPAGFGKTQLLREWAASRNEPIAWISLDVWENDLVRWGAALHDALQSAGVVAGGMAHVTNSVLPTPAGIVSTLLANLQSPCTLILDDYHVITDESVRQAVIYLLNHLPPAVRVVIASRSLPRLPLARLHVQGALLRLDAADLAFSTQESGHLLCGLHGLKISPAEIHSLTEATGGWPAALQLCALSLRDQPISATLEQLTSERNLAAFLSEEVLGRLPEPQRRFLGQTAILDQLAAPLCEAVTGQPNAHASLEGLEAAGLLAATPGGDSTWYQMQPLLREFLQAHMQKHQRGLVSEVHRRAAVWYLREGMPYPAVDHAQQGQDLPLLCDLVERFGRSLWMRGEVATLSRWMEGIPESAVCASTRLSLLRGWTSAHLGQVETAEVWVKAADHRLRGEGQTDDVGRGEAAAIRARLAAIRSDASGALHWSRRALGLLPENELALRGDLYMNIGHALAPRSLKGAADAFARAARLGTETNNPRTAIYAMQYLSGVRSSQGQLREATSILEEALQLASRSGWANLPATGSAHVALAHLLYERNQLDAALEQADRGLALGERGGEAKILFSGYLARARINAALGQKAQARTNLRRMERAIGGLSSGAWRAQVLLHLGDLPSVLVWLKEIGITPADTPAADRLLPFLILLQSLRLTGRPTDGLNLARRLVEAEESSGRRGVVIRLKVQQALLQEAARQQSEAVANLQAVLAEARSEGWVRTFINEGTAMASLLAEVLKQPTGHRACIDYGNHLLGLMTGIIPGAGERLSQREAEVLRLLAEGCSNQEMAQRLFVTLGTVKTHVHRIYQKLGVTSRTQAVASGRALGLIG